MRAAVLGSPIGHSRSPALHRAASAALGLTGFAYERFEVTAEGLAEFLSTHPDHLGFSLTMPLKHELLRLARQAGWTIEDTAARTGAGNTLVRAPGRPPQVLNTDVIGIVRALQDAGAGTGTATGAGTGTATGLTGTVLGNGATAASATAALARLGVGAVEFCVRAPERARTVAEAARGLGMDVTVTALADWRPGVTDITVSTLPGGVLDATLPAWPERFAHRPVLLDVAYGGRTKVAAEFTARSGAVVPGTAMLVHQAAEQFVAFADAAGVDIAAQRTRIVSAMAAA